MDGWMSGVLAPGVVSLNRETKSRKAHSPRVIIDYCEEVGRVRRLVEAETFRRAVSETNLERRGWAVPHDLPIHKTKPEGPRPPPTGPLHFGFKKL